MILRSWILILVSAAISITGYAADGSDWRNRVWITVVSNDSALKNQITSFLSRELRSLGDVDITDTNPSYKLSIVAMAVALEGGHNAGYALSILVTSPLGDLRWALSENLNPESKAAISEMLATKESLEDFRLLVGSFDSLKKSITKFVANFDAEELEPLRRMRQQSRDAIKKE